MSCDHGYADPTDCAYCKRDLEHGQAETLERIADALERLVESTSRRPPAGRPPHMNERPVPVALRVSQQVWRAVTAAIRCLDCGHDHYGWQHDGDPRLAPQWTWCDRTSCPCRCLVRGAA